MPKEQKIRFAQEDEMVSEPDYKKESPSDTDLALIEQEYIQAFETEPFEISPLDIHHDQDGLAQYMADLKPHLKPRFNTKEEDDAMFQAKDKEGLFYSVAKMVVSQAFKHASDRVSVMDLIQAGNVAVLKDAIRTYKPEKSKFSTWAMWHIRQAIFMELNGNFRECRISPNDVTDTNKVQKTYFNLMGLKGRKPTRQEIADSTGFTLTKVDYLRDIEKRVFFSLTSPSVPGSETENHDVVGDKNALSGDALERNIVYKQTLEAVYKKTLNFPARNSRNAELLMLRLGCDKNGVWTGKVWTPTEIGRLFSVTRERAKQLQWRAVDLIKDPELQEILRIYLDPKN